MLSFSQTRGPRPFVEVFNKLGERKPVASHSAQRLGTWFAANVKQRQDVAVSLTKLGRSEFGHDLELPPTPLITAEIVSGRHGRPVEVLEAQLAEYDQAFDAAMRKYPFFGTVKYTGSHECVITYCDAEKSFGVFQTAHHIRAHEHHLVNARERKLTDSDVVLPRKQHRIVRQLPEAFLPSVRVITGMLVLQKENEAGVVRRDHVVGKTLKEIGRAARQYGPQALRGAAAGMAVAGGVLGVTAVVSSIVSALSTAAVVAVADPALVIGDVVVSGWL